MAKLDTVELLIEKEDYNHSVSVTQYPVEEGEPFSDHVQKNPSDFAISGFLLSDNWQTDFDKLKSLMEKGTVVKYVGKRALSNVIILDIKEVHEKSVSNGGSVSISLRYVRITKSAWKAAPPKKAATQKPPTQAGKKKPIPPKSKPVTNTAKAVYHVIKRGDTYWAMSKKYGTSISQLRSWNKWKDTALPIGGKARVK